MGEVSRVTVEPDVTSVNSWRIMTDSRPSVRCRPKDDCYDYQMQEQNATNSPNSMNNERKRKTKLNAAEVISELSARKKIKMSIVPAVNLYD